MERARARFRTRILCHGFFAWGALLAVGVAQPARGESPQQELRVLQELAVPAQPSPALTVRWASDETVYLTRAHHGVAEVALDGNLTVRRQPIPDRQTLGISFTGVERLAVSPEYFAISSLTADFGFRPRVANSAGTYKFTKLRLWDVYALDLYGDRLLMLGDPTPRASASWAETGRGVGWIGPISEHPERDLKPFLDDVAGAPPESLFRCSTLGLGTVRFLADGSYLVVPGFQEGVFLYGPAGALLRRWNNAAVGLDAPDCASMDQKQEDLFAGSYKARFEFLNQHRVLEEILPLAEGPALLIRYVLDGSVHWTLSVLHGDQMTSYQVPVTGSLPFDRLRADVRGNRIVFLRTWLGFDRGEDLRPGRLYVVELAPSAKAVPQ